ncbi:hypothetical protein VTO73DRAFT_13785 [Trametes versicolor]
MSSSVSPEIIAELAYLSQETRTSYALTVAATTLLLYDTVLCIEKEVNYVWGSPKTSRRVSRILYVYNRYMSVIWNILTLALVDFLQR